MCGHEKYENTLIVHGLAASSSVTKKENAKL